MIKQGAKAALKATLNASVLSIKKKDKVTLSIDAEGGDHGLKTTLPAVKSVAKKFPLTQFILVGSEDKLKRALSKLGMSKLPNIQIQHASEIVGMDESPAVALRTKKDSSMRVAINLVKSGEAQACVSAGNTGALMATSRFVLKMLPGVDRPAIVFQIPAYDKINQEVKTVYMLDLGANVECSAEHLHQFAVMGSALAASEGVDNPRVVLLNIGEEDIKGLDYIKGAAKILTEDNNINYSGFIEGDKINFVHADVVVCDGFVGNIALKTSEGIMRMIGAFIKHELKSSLWMKLLTPLFIPLLRRMKKRMNMAQYNGASLLGLKGVVLKSHGGASAKAFETAIIKAIHEAQNNIPELIHHQIEKMLGHEQSA